VKKIAARPLLYEFPAAGGPLVGVIIFHVARYTNPP